jgi:hypothetical protein
MQFKCSGAGSETVLIFAMSGIFLMKMVPAEEIDAVLEVP